MRSISSAAMSLAAIALSSCIVIGLGTGEATAARNLCYDDPDAGFCPKENGYVCLLDVRQCRFFDKDGNFIGARVRAAHKKTSPAQSLTREVKRSLFSGNKSQLTQFSWFRSDCTSTMPVVRIVKAPANGTLNLEEGRTKVWGKHPLNVKCGDKVIESVRLFYTSKDKFSGTEKFTLDVDNAIGAVFRYNFIVDVKSTEVAGHQKEFVQMSASETKLNRSVLSGNEARIAAMNYVNSDCTSGALPLLRVVTPPKNGDVRLEETSIALDRRADDPRAICNGTPVQAVGVYYKAKADFSGSDEMVIDVDFNHGKVRRFVYAITIQ